MNPTALLHSITDSRLRGQGKLKASPPLNSILHPKKVTHQSSLGGFLRLYLLMFGGGTFICHVLKHPALKVTVHSSLSLTPNEDSLSSRVLSLPIWMVSLDPEALPYLETIPKSGCLNYLKYDL